MKQLIAAHLVLAQVAGDLPNQIGQVINLVMLFGFLFGVALIISGAMAINRGDPEKGKLAIIAGAIIAAAPAIMKAVFVIFKLGNALPDFK